MAILRFLRLSADWNAEPNAPEPLVQRQGSDVRLEFFLNAFAYPAFREGEKGALWFGNVSKFRLGATNDEGWFRGQCRYSKTAPEWGEFYELVGDDPLAEEPTDWQACSGVGQRHFLFYLCDNTFEAFADEWTFEADASH
jgi:hypothetical protein